MAKMRCITIPLPSPQSLPRPSDRISHDFVLKVFNEGIRLKSLHSRLVPKRKAKSAWQSPVTSPKSKDIGTDTGLDIWVGKEKPKTPRLLRTAGNCRNSREKRLWRGNKEGGFSEEKGWSRITTLECPDIVLPPKTSILHIEEIYSPQRKTHFRDSNVIPKSSKKQGKRLLSAAPIHPISHKKSLSSLHESPQLPEDACEDALPRNFLQIRTLWKYRNQSSPQALSIFDIRPILTHKAHTDTVFAGPGLIHRKGKSEPRGT